MNSMKNPWKCNKCQSTNVSQEWSAFLPMNLPAEAWGDLAWEEGLDSYWCEECEDACDPIRDEEQEHGDVAQLG